MTPEARAVAEDLLCSADRVRFAARCGLVTPDPWQVQALTSTAPRECWVVHRQGGKSSVAGIIAAHTALYVPGSLTLCVSPSLRQSAELFRKVLAAWRACGKPIPAESESKLSIELESGSRVVSLPGTETTTRGYSSPDLILCDEASRIDDDLMVALRPMQATNADRARLLALSTPWGQRGWFWRAFSEGGDEWARVVVPATSCPRISPSFLAAERRELGELTYRAEYLAEFVDPEGTVFGADLLRRALTRDVAPLWPDQPPPMPPGLPTVAALIVPSRN